MAAFGGLAPATIKAYCKWLEKFQTFCRKIGVQWDKAGPAEIAIFLQELVDTGLAGGTAAQASCAISWATQIADLPDPTKNRMVESVIAAAKRIP